MNAQDCIDKVRSGSYPSFWQVYRGQGQYAPAIFFLIMIITFFLICVFPSLFFTGVGYTLSIFGVPMAVCVLIGWILFASGAQYKKSFLVITPEGVAMQYQGKRGKEITWMTFAGIKELEIMQEARVSGNSYGVDTYYRYWLGVYGYDGVYTPWSISKEFEDQITLCKKIVAAYRA